jgi:hypothetical protein
LCGEVLAFVHLAVTVLLFGGRVRLPEGALPSSSKRTQGYRPQRALPRAHVGGLPLIVLLDIDETKGA